jgi:proteic killer suppression protein
MGTHKLEKCSCRKVCGNLGNCFSSGRSVRGLPARDATCTTVSPDPARVRRTVRSREFCEKFAIDRRSMYRYTIRDDQKLPAPGVEKFFRSGSKAGIRPKHAGKLRLTLFALDNARRPGDMNPPGWKLHPLAGEFKDHWAISASGNWSLTFKFEGEDEVLVDYQDYHWHGHGPHGAATGEQEIVHAHAPSAASGPGSSGISRRTGRIRGRCSSAGYARDSVASAEWQVRNFGCDGDPAGGCSGHHARTVDEHAVAVRPLARAASASAEGAEVCARGGRVKGPVAG